MLINGINMTIRKVSIDKDPTYSKKYCSTFVSAPAALQGCAIEKIEIKISDSFMSRTSFSGEAALDLCVADITKLGCESNNQDEWDVRAMKNRNE